MKLLWLATLMAVTAPGIASAAIVNVDASNGFNYVPGGGSDPAPVAGDQISFVGTPPTLSLAAGTYTITNATGEAGADPNLTAWSYNVGTSSWAWRFVLATASGTVINFYDAGSGSSKAYVAGLASVQDFSTTFTLAAPTTVAFTLQDYYVPDNAGGVSLDVQPFATSTPGVPEPAAWTLMIGGFGLTGGAMRRRRAMAGQLA